MYRALTGVLPPDSIDRLRGVVLPDFNVPVSAPVHSAILHGMALLAKDRIQTMEQLLLELGINQTAAIPVTPIVAAPAPAPVPAPVQSRFCGVCGKPLEPNAKFCKACGSSTDGQIINSPPPAAVAATTAKPAATGNMKKLIIIAVAVVVAIVAGVLIYRGAMVAGAEDKINEFILEGDYQSAYDYPDKLKLKNAEELKQSILLENLAAFAYQDYITNTEYNYTDSFVLEKVYFNTRVGYNDIVDYDSYFTVLMYGPKLIDTNNTTNTYVISRARDSDHLPQWYWFTNDLTYVTDESRQSVKNITETINDGRYENGMVNIERINELKENRKLDIIEKIDIVKE
jgi:hypothetical protein